MALKKTPFSRGVNLTKWFEVQNTRTLKFDKFTEQDFANIKSLGADVIRLPIRMHDMTARDPACTLDPLLLEYMDTVIGWAEKHKLYIILDNHSFHPLNPTDVNIDRILVKVWAQLARRYKDRGEYLIYEVLNEPHKIDDGRWAEIQEVTIDAIRQIDTVHPIMVGGTEYNSIDKLLLLPEYKDNNLIYTFHFYDPHIFTHQGATWDSPSLAPLTGVPFPLDGRKIPKIPESFKGTWAEASLKNYEHEAAFSTLTATLEKAAEFAKKRDVPVFCGEFGVYMIQIPHEDRVKWYEFVTGELEKLNISWAIWDYFGGFGLFNTVEGGDFNKDLNLDVVRALGLTPPAKKETL